MELLSLSWKDVSSLSLLRTGLGDGATEVAGVALREWDSDRGSVRLEIPPTS